MNCSTASPGTMHFTFYHILVILLFVPALFITSCSLGLSSMQIKDKPYVQISNGTGKTLLPDNSTYQGEFRNGIFNGKGTLVWKNSAKYVGDFKDGLMHGKGVLESNGNKYEGDFIEGVFGGKGIFTYGNGDIYKGEFKNGIADGIGVYLFKNGDKYTGSFKAWRMHGDGILSMKNGEKYVGEFQNRAFHGKGTLYLKNPKGNKIKLEGQWKKGKYVSVKKNSQATKAHNIRFNPEVVLYNQYSLLNNSLKNLYASQPNVPDLYFVSFGGDALQDVFMKEARFSKNLFEEKFGAKNRTLMLVNNKKVVDDLPLASVTNLRKAIQAIGKLMNPKEDLLFLFLTSHGSKEHSLVTHLRGVPLEDLKPTTLAEILKEAGIKWKVILISACYSGGFIKALQDDYSMIITSAKADRVSFGCTNDATFTYFSRAFFKHALTESDSFKQAFTKAGELVKIWEDDQDYDHSEPQISTTPLIEEKLSQWRMTLDTPP